MKKFNIKSLAAGIIIGSFGITTAFAATVSGNDSSYETSGGIISEENAVLNLANHAGQKNIAESGSFEAEPDQTLILNVTSDIKGGSVDLFLFDPNGKEHRVTIGSDDMTEEIPLEKGVWQYNCSGMFKDGGNIKIIGTIKSMSDAEDNR